MFWRQFPTKNAVENAIREVVNSQPMKIPFASSLISDLILERHYFCSLRKLRPSRFRKIPGYGAYQFEGDFAGQPTPKPIGWHPVSWAKCLVPQITEWNRVVRAMRDRIEPVKAEYGSRHCVCETCGLRPVFEVHHASPTFHTISEAVRAQVSSEDVETCFAGWDWFLGDNFALPETHTITVKFDAIHSSVRLEALCKECHNETKRGSKSKRPPSPATLTQ